ncbi:MAG: penicillin acylase family protein [Candidatus Binatia bacterium]
MTQGSIRWRWPLSCLIGIFLWSALICSSSFAQQATTAPIKVSGLIDTVEISIDRWGIAHIYAKNQHDLFFAQGYNAARDRLFQLEIWRRRVTGTMAEIQGAKALDRDIGARLLRFRGDLNQEMKHYHQEGPQIIAAFVEGINAYIKQTKEIPELLPLEFRLLEITPQLWTPDVVISRIGGLFMNLSTETALARQIRTAGTTATLALNDFYPEAPDLTLPTGVDLETLPDTVLRYYTAARAGVQFTPEDVISSARPDTASIAAISVPSLFSLPQLSPSSEGSNNWVITGSRTLTRHPMMANDPHRGIMAPSLRYWVHLVAPGWNVIGGGEPHLPGVSIGHNQYGAWGLTIFPTDSEDLYVYETNPDNPNQYRYKGKWEAMQVQRETFAVKGQTSVTVDLKYTRHGPVLAEDLSQHKAYALRAAWLDIGAAPYLASLRMDQAKNWEEFREACFSSHAPSENMVWADVSGNIGWQATGIVPRRSNWSGVLPVPGDGRFEWDGILPNKDLPFVYNPPEGFFATANAENLPPGYPHQVSFLWEPPYRLARIHELLNSGMGMTLSDMMQWQNDELSLPARMLVPLLRDLRSANAIAQAALERLRMWDYVLAKDSVAAGIYAAWQQRLWENFRDQLIPESARQYFSEMAPQRLIDSLTSPDSRYGEIPTAGRDRFLIKSLEQAVHQLTAQLGPNMDKWSYGQPGYHHITIRHMLGQAVNSRYRAQLEVGPFPRGGDGFTVNNTDNNAEQAIGASFRIIADLGDWDRSLGATSPGQAGNPESPHYRDLADMWAAGKYFPIFYSRAKIVSVTEQKIELRP